MKIGRNLTALAVGAYSLFNAGCSNNNFVMKDSDTKESVQVEDKVHSYFNIFSLVSGTKDRYLTVTQPNGKKIVYIDENKDGSLDKIIVSLNGNEDVFDKSDPIKSRLIGLNKYRFLNYVSKYKSSEESRLRKILE